MLALCAAAVLAGCTSAQDIFEPSALAADASNPLPQALFPTADGTSSPRMAAINSSARLRFAPVVGAASEASTPLAARIAERAALRGITLTAADDTSATHTLKGYFSAISERAGTTVIYVWDVMDATGTRVHRIQGQAKSPAGNGQGWAGVQPPTMHAIADQTVDQIAAWLTTDQG